MPRLVIVIMIILTSVLLWIDGGTGTITRPWGQAVALVVFLTTAGTLTVGMFFSTARSVWWGRLGDILQIPITAGILLSVVTTAELTNVMRQL